MYQVSAEESARSILRARRKYEEVYTSAINGRARAEAKLAAAEAKLSEVAAERDTAAAERDTLQQALAEARAEIERLKG